jgi:hypothetical protein
VTPSADGNTAAIAFVAFGVVVVSATGDKKHGPDVSPFVASLDVQCQPLDVESVSIEVDPAT